MKTGGAKRQEMGKENRFLAPPSKGGDRHIRKVEKEKTISRGPGAGRAYDERSRSAFYRRKL